MQRLAQAFAPRPVTVRFLDNIDVQRPGFVPEGSERNPALGERGVRFLLKEPARSEILYAQIWAAMTANHNLGNLRVMVPMVSVPEEMVEVKKAMDEVEAGIKQKKIPYQRPLLGMMVEVPAAALAVERFVALVDFISLGTNDLVQYLMAAARDNSAVSPLAHDFSPAVVWTVRRAIKSARNTAGGMKKPDFRVGICGEMARNPLAVALLLGLGVDSFSVSPRFVPGVKEVIAKLDLKDCRDLAVGLRKEMAGGRVGEPKQIEAFIRSRFPQVFAA
jgi:phosphoenolpyruvate-protein kinase (PTS system EI component)